MRPYKLMCIFVLASPLIGFGVSIGLMMLFSCTGGGAGITNKYAPQEFCGFLSAISIMSVFGWIVTTPLGIIMLRIGRAYEKREIEKRNG